MTRARGRTWHRLASRVAARDDRGMTTPQDILTFWFDTLTPAQRFARDDAVDADIARCFGALHAAFATAGVPQDWTATADGRLAAILVLDQFSRNLHRDSSAAFAQDAAALALAEVALAHGDDRRGDADRAAFLYLPFEHSETLADQDRSVALFTALGQPFYLDFAVRHRDLIMRFGRFPHRNAELGRTSTAAELAFLAAQGRGF